MSASAIRIALASRAAAAEVESRETTWEQICKNLSSVKVGPKDGPGWVAADIDSGPRRNDRVRTVSVLVLDIEGKNGAIPPDLESVQSRLKLLGYDAHVHTTYNHAPESPRYRVIVRLDAPIAPTILKQALSTLADRIGLSDCWDRQCTDPARLFYKPRCPAGREHLFEFYKVDGQPLDIARLEELIRRRSAANILPFPALHTDYPDFILQQPEIPQNIARVESMLASVSADCDRETWRNVVWAVMSTGWSSAYKLAQKWSQTAPDLFDQTEFDRLVDSFKPEGGITLGTLQHYAQQEGWSDGELLASATSRRFTLRSAEEIRNLPPLKWRIKGLLPQTGLAAIIGPSGSGKTFLALDLIARVASGDEFFEFRTESCPVVYLALEGSAGISSRIKAFEKHHNTRLPDTFHIVTDRLSLLSMDVVELAQVMIDNALKESVIVIDTMAQASPGADENSSADMSRLISNAQQLQQLTDSLVILIHHTGKDTSRGARGHSSLTAALDTVIEVKQTQAGREWVVAKSKDGEDGLKRSFRLQQVQLGLDDEGEPITSCLAVPDSSALFAKPPLTGINQKAIWTAISEKHSAGDEVTHDELQKLSSSAVTITSNKGQRIKETITALTVKGYLTQTGERYQIN